ncbi:hypothetical protein NDU88_005243 [Pleurodeles waltl]|uniref:Uncharacterized protein n=1 Tax=Pleurodeles waltl TaxID=8319 RepID=A0AAV7T9X1_PLEWA|nr:hypothetical protein NDU88_005243 [Pleurodeles waltl]
MHLLPRSPLCLTPRRRLQGTEVDPLPDCVTTTPSFPLGCGRKSPRTRPRPVAANSAHRLSSTGAPAGPSYAQAVPGLKVSGARPRPTVWALTCQTTRGPQPQPPPPSTLREQEGGREEAQAPPRAPAVSLCHVGDARERAQSSTLLPQAALLKEPPTPRGATGPTHRVQATQPGELSGGARPHTQHGPQPLRLQALHSPAATPTASRGPGGYPRRLHRPGEASVSSPVATRGSPQTWGAAREVPPHRPEAAAPRQERFTP